MTQGLLRLGYPLQAIQAMSSADVQREFAVADVLRELAQERREEQEWMQRSMAESLQVAQSQGGGKVIGQRRGLSGGGLLA